MAEFKLSYTANEINEKLGKVDNLVSTVNGVVPDVDGNIEVANGIIDVLELPTENINENVFYRLMTAKFVSNYYSAINDWVCYCVNELPSAGEPVSTDMINITGYYNAQDGEVYGYADSMISAAGGIPVGWYPIGTLAQAFDINWGGVITDINDTDDSAKVLLSKDFYIYQDGWTETIFAYEKAPEFDITWDGVIGDRFALDMTAFGEEGTYLVKVSDRVFTSEELIGMRLTTSNGFDDVISEYDIDDTMYPGTLVIYDGTLVIVYDENNLNAALGLPASYITNGTYFVYIVDSLYANRLVAPPKVTKIASKYIDISDINASEIDGLAGVAISGDYNHLNNRPNVYTDVIRYSVTQSLPSGNKQKARNNIDVYSKSEVDTKIANAGTSVDLSGYAKTTEVETMIAEAIGSAIGGSY